MADNKTIFVTGKYLGVNSNNGVGSYHARIFIRKENGSDVDGLVPLNVFGKLRRGETYSNLKLTRANDPALASRTWS